jgi:hypothetical protein
MFRIGINSAPRIASTEVSETHEAPAQPAEQQEVLVEPKSAAFGNSSIRSEAMFSATAMRAQLTQQLARNESLNRSPLTSEEANQQISFQPDYDYEKKFSKDFLENLRSVNTLFTGDGNDAVFIEKGSDGLVHVHVNGKEAWSGTEKEFQLLTIDTGGGDDYVTNSVSSAKILTGDGSDLVRNYSNQSRINTGDGDDEVRNHGNDNEIRTGSGDDLVLNFGAVQVSRWGVPIDEYMDSGGGDRNIIDTGDGMDEVHLGSLADDNRISTGSGDDGVSDWGSRNQVDTGEDD